MLNKKSPKKIAKATESSLATASTETMVNTYAMVTKENKEKGTSGGKTKEATINTTKEGSPKPSKSLVVPIKSGGKKAIMESSVTSAQKKSAIKESSTTPAKSSASNLPK